MIYSDRLLPDYTHVDKNPFNEDKVKFNQFITLVKKPGGIFCKKKKNNTMF